MDLNTCFETTSELRQLSLYAHLVPAFASIVLGWFAVRYAASKKKAVIFLFFTWLFALWMIGDVIIWNTNNYYTVAGIWSSLDYINTLFFLALLYFLYIDFFKPSRTPRWLTVVLITAAVYPLLLTISGLAVNEFDQPNCEMYENDSLSLYKVYLETGVVAFITFIGVLQTIRKWSEKKVRNHVMLLTSAAVLFMGLFGGSEYIATITDVYEINLYSLFALPVFMFILTFAVTEQQMFQTKASSLTSVQLLFSLFVIVGIMDIFLADTVTQYIVSGVGSFITLSFGVLLWRSASRENKQRKEIEELAEKLASANERLKELDKLKSEFVSIASHQLRSPLTSIRGYASMLAEGSFGKLPKKAEDAAVRIEDSAKLMALSVEDYLNVSRIESGNMKYVLSDFNLRDEVDHICDDVRSEAMKKGLVLLFRSSIQSRGVVHADIGKTTQIVHNLINNSLKYTQQGSIKVLVRDDAAKKRIFVEITDTGIGLSKESAAKLFHKFERAHNANSVNVSGTGLGLYVAQKMAEAMGGDITVTSEGEGKGSTFTLVMPLAL
ncbi:MAG: HAMP domain-containing sensor histidine kinase [Patescibacteria group bacterium]